MRTDLSAKLRGLAEVTELEKVTPLEAWLLQRRVEWAAQFAVEAVGRGLEPGGDPVEILMFVLIGSWDSDGWRGLRKKASGD